MKPPQFYPQKHRKTLTEEEIAADDSDTILTDIRKLLEFNVA